MTRRRMQGAGRTPAARGTPAVRRTPAARRAPDGAGARPEADAALLAECRVRSLDLLRANLTRHGIRASTPHAAARARAYDAVFARDAAICALALATCGDRALARRAHLGLDALARRQAANGQLPKFVDPARDEGDFWYLGCIDATLWWLLWIAVVDAARDDGASGGGGVRTAARASGRARSPAPLRERHAPRIERALAWLHAQEHPRFGLLQQNEASDWADIMPRSGYVLYTNALWLAVQRTYAWPRAARARTRAHFHGLFHPYSATVPEYRRAKLLASQACAGVADRRPYLAFVNFGGVGGEGDVFGNVLAIALGAIEGPVADAALDAFDEAGVAAPFPSRAVATPIGERSLLWRPYMARHGQNYAWQYHNGGAWPMIGGFHALALVERGRHAAARALLAGLARACRARAWGFPEWLHGRTGAPRGMRGQSWSAAGFLLAEAAVRTGRNPLRDLLRTAAS